MQLYVALVALFSALLVSASASSISARAHRKRGIDTTWHCGKWDFVTAGPYSLNLDLWGTSGESGWQCARLLSEKDNVVAWATVYDWPSGYGIKSFTDIQLNAGLNKQLSAIQSMPAKWKWSMSTNDVVADVAFDFFTSDFPGGPNVNEVMIWLANLNSGPISYDYSIEGNSVAYASGIQILGTTWNLYVGSNGANKVYSFLLADGSHIKSLDGDIYGFFKYLMENQGLDQNQYLITAQAGTEVMSGNGYFTTKKYSLVIN